METNPTNKYCLFHQQAIEELWKGEWLCEACYQEYHIDREHMIEDENEKQVREEQLSMKFGGLCDW